MSKRFRDYLLDTYIHQGDYLPRKIRKNFPIQIDDQGSLFALVVLLLVRCFIG